MTKKERKNKLVWALIAILVSIKSIADCGIDILKEYLQ